MEEKRFQTIYSQEEDTYGHYKTMIIKDTKTGVMYLCRANDGYQHGGIGLAVLVDRDGKPLTDTYRVMI